LKKHSFPAASFAVSESVTRGLNGSMPVETFKELIQSGLVTVGSHTKTHPLLSKLPEAEMTEEIFDSKKDLEAILGVPVLYFAYPSGDIDERVVSLTEKAGYRLAFTTSYKKLKGLKAGLHTLERVKITRSSDWPFAYWFQISGIYQFFKRR
jgi:peptidoglycan/xylan/chitin deacetylase (PgdA/CDA1 family)